MNITGLDAALSAVSAQTPMSIQEDVSVAVLGNALDMTQTIGTEMIQMMEHSVAPNLGSNIDIYI